MKSGCYFYLSILLLSVSSFTGLNSFFGSSSVEAHELGTTLLLNHSLTISLHSKATDSKTEPPFDPPDGGQPRDTRRGVKQ